MCGAVIAAGLSPAAALTQVSGTPQLDEASLLTLTDQIRSEIQQGNIEKANRLASDLLWGLVRLNRSRSPSPSQKLLELETKGIPNEFERPRALAQLACAAFDAGDHEKARRYAEQALDVASQTAVRRNSQWAVFKAHTVLGRIAIRGDDIAPAGLHLTESARITPGDAVLATFGPDMDLAKALLEKGQREVVLQFLDLCSSSGRETKGNWRVGAQQFVAGLFRTSACTCGERGCGRSGSFRC